MRGPLRDLRGLDTRDKMSDSRTEVLTLTTQYEKATGQSVGSTLPDLTRNADETSAQANVDFTFAFHNVKELHAVI